MVLIAVDGRFITCDIADDGTLGEATRVGLPAGMATEQVCYAALGERWVAVLSRGSDRRSASEHLALHDRATLTERACISRLLHRSPDPNVELLADVDFDAETMFELFGITDAPDGSAPQIESATRLDRLAIKISRMTARRTRGSRLTPLAPEERRPPDQPPRASWTGLAFGAADHLYVGWGAEGIGVLHLGGHAPGDVGRPGVPGSSALRPAWTTRAPVPMTRLRLEAPVEGVVTVPGEPCLLYTSDAADE